MERITHTMRRIPAALATVTCIVDASLTLRVDVGVARTVSTSICRHMMSRLAVSSDVVEARPGHVGAWRSVMSDAVWTVELAALADVDHDAWVDIFASVHRLYEKYFVMPDVMSVDALLSMEVSNGARHSPESITNSEEPLLHMVESLHGLGMAGTSGPRRRLADAIACMLTFAAPHRMGDILRERSSLAMRELLSPGPGRFRGCALCPMFELSYTLVRLRIAQHVLLPDDFGPRDSDDNTEMTRMLILLTASCDIERVSDIAYRILVERIRAEPGFIRRYLASLTSSDRQSDRQSDQQCRRQARRLTGDIPEPDREYVDACLRICEDCIECPICNDELDTDESCNRMCFLSCFLKHYVCQVCWDAMRPAGKEKKSCPFCRAECTVRCTVVISDPMGHAQL